MSISSCNNAICPWSKITAICNIKTGTNAISLVHNHAQACVFILAILEWHSQEIIEKLNCYWNDPMSLNGFGTQSTKVWLKYGVRSTTSVCGVFFRDTLMTKALWKSSVLTVISFHHLTDCESSIFHCHKNPAEGFEMRGSIMPCCLRDKCLEIATFLFSCSDPKKSCMPLCSSQGYRMDLDWFYLEYILLLSCFLCNSLFWYWLSFSKREKERERE